jgi:nucleoid-associated protein YgaU
MTRDFKIGLAVGLVAAISAVIWLCTLPKLSTKVRALQSAASHQAAPVSDRRAPVVDVPATVVATHADQQKNELTAEHAETAEKKYRKNSADSAVSAVKNEQPPVKFYIVQKGDTLSAISAKYYGSPNEWPKIAAANKIILPNPDNLTPGLRLVIPE